MDKYKVGDKVVYIADRTSKKGLMYYNEYSQPYSGTVKTILDDGVIVKWDSTYPYSDKLYPKDYVMLKEKFLEIDAKLEIEFNEIKSEINEKLSKAEKLINEANALAIKGGKDSLREFDFDRGFISSIENAGWNTSSMSC